MSSWRWSMTITPTATSPPGRWTVCRQPARSAASRANYSHVQTAFPCSTFAFFPTPIHPSPIEAGVLNLSTPVPSLSSRSMVAEVRLYMDVNRARGVSEVWRPCKFAQIFTAASTQLLSKRNMNRTWRRGTLQAYWKLQAMSMFWTSLAVLYVLSWCRVICIQKLLKMF